MRTMMRWILNLAIAGCVGVLAWQLMERHSRPSPTPQAAVVLFELGSRLPLGKSAEVRRLVLVIDSECPGCRASAKEIKRVASVAETMGVPVQVVTADTSEDAVEWLEAVSVPYSEVVQVTDLSGVGFAMTPTVLIVGADDVISDAVEGELLPAWSERVISRLAGRDMEPVGAIAARPNYVSPGLRPTAGTQLLLVADRAIEVLSKPPGSLHIPIDELDARARAELAAGEPVRLLSCDVLGVRYCQVAALILAENGFSDVMIETKEPPTKAMSAPR